MMPRVPPDLPRLLPEQKDAPILAPPAQIEMLQTENAAPASSLEREAPGVSASILEGLAEILTVTRLGLPLALPRSLACTNIIENMNGTIRQVCRNSLPPRRRGSNAGRMPGWHCAGPPPCWRPPRVSGGPRPTGNVPSCGPRWPPLRPGTPATPSLNSKPGPHSLINQ
jgi:hypothetical protein